MSEAQQVTTEQVNTAQIDADQIEELRMIHADFQASIKLVKWAVSVLAVPFGVGVLTLLGMYIRLGNVESTMSENVPKITKLVEQDVVDIVSRVSVLESQEMRPGARAEIEKLTGQVNAISGKLNERAPSDVYDLLKNVLVKQQETLNHQQSTLDDLAADVNDIRQNGSSGER